MGVHYHPPCRWSGLPRFASQHLSTLHMLSRPVACVNVYHTVGQIGLAYLSAYASLWTDRTIVFLSPRTHTHTHKKANLNPERERPRDLFICYVNRSIQPLVRVRVCVLGKSCLPSKPCVCVCVCVGPCLAQPITQERSVGRFASANAMYATEKRASSRRPAEEQEKFCPSERRGLR